MPRLRALALLVLPGLALASERHFAYAYESAVLAPGDKEIEIHYLNERGKDAFRYYSEVAARLEIEVGVTDRLMTAFYLNFAQVAKLGAKDGSADQSFSEFEGFSWEWKYKHSDPVADVVGFASYVELEWKAEEVALEFKAILDKRVGQHLFAANLVWEIEGEFENNDHIEFEEHKVDVIASALHLFTPKFGVGIETTWRNVIVEGELEHSALFLGPTAFYNAGSFWATLTVLPQITAFEGETGDTGKDTDEFTEYEIQLVVGLHF